MRESLFGRRKASRDDAANPSTDDAPAPSRRAARSATADAGPAVSQPARRGAPAARAERPSRLARTPTWLQTRPARLALGWLERSWAMLLITIIGLALIISAIVVPGTKAADLHLNDGTIYVPSRVRGLVGVLNYEIDELSTAASVGSNDFRIIQDQRTVLIHAQASNQLQAYDPITNAMGAPVTLPSDALVSLGNGILAVTNPNSGKVWFGEVDAMLKTDFQRAKAQLDVAEFGRAVVTSSGKVIGLNIKTSQIVRPEGSETPVVALPFTLDPAAVGGADLSAVGDKAIVLDRTGQLIWAEGDNNPTTITSGSTAFLAPPAPHVRAAGSDASAIYSTQAGLNVLTNRGVRSASGLLNGTTIEPLIVGDCAYGANGDRVVTACAGAEPLIQEIPQLPTGAQLTWVANRTNVALTDQTSGMTWLVNKGMKIVDNWERVAPADKTANMGNRRSEDQTPPDRTKPNRAPVAEDDLAFGARAGRSTTLHVLDNDSDPDGDILTILQPPEIEGATLQLTGNGSGLQITLPSDATGTYTFTYRVSDGRGLTDDARVQVKAVSPDPLASNQRPINIRPAEVFEVAQGSTSTYRVLLNWRDPDGDDLVLANAWLDGDSEDEVRFTPDGTITFIDIGKVTGAKRIYVSVSDGVQATDGVLLVETINRGVVPPRANGDFVTVTTNTPIVINPLANDNGANLSLRSVESEGGDVTLTPNYNEGTFEFRSPNVGVYYVVYKVSNGPVATGLVRVNVIAQTGENHPPVAARDVALLPFGGSVVIDPIANDTDPDGDVLVVQTVQSSDPAIQVVLEERHLLTISADRMPTAPVTLTYWVSDGHAAARGTISVIPSPARGTQRPRAVNDEVKVRAGATATVHVLRNDSSPIGLPLRLKTLTANPLGEGAWIDGDVVRVAVPDTAATTTLTVTYQIEDTLRVTDAAAVNVTVISADAENEAPRPLLTEARVLSGSTTRIPIRLDGIDPNGDAVRLLGLGSGPSLGRITTVGDGWLGYEAYADSRGTDSFRYQVIDSLGAVGTGEVRVGVAPPSMDNAKPTAVADELTVRPGRFASWPVLRNDFDIDGDVFGFPETDKVTMPFTATVSDTHHVELTAPSEVGEYAGNYRIVDARGAENTGNLSLFVREDAELLPPVAVDDQVLISDVLGKEWISVDVMENDYDLDGPKESLTLSVPTQTSADAEARASVVDGELRINVADAMQQIRYVITDADGNMAQAVVAVPGRNDSVPVVKDPKHVPTVVAGQQLAIDINTLVAGTQGRQVKLTSVDTVRATKGVATVPGEDRLVFVADIRYAGPASVVFEVIDVAPGAEDSARRAFISIPITVTPAPDVQQGSNEPGGVANRAPMGPDEVNLEIGAGDPENSVNVRALFTDPEGDNFEFEDWRVERANDQIKWTADVGNGVISASADVKARGASMVLMGRVFDALNAGRDVRVTITTVGSLRPRPQAELDEVPDANAGQMSLVPVLLNDRSNLLNDTSLQLLEAQVISGEGTAEVRGDEVAVTPATDYVGPMLVRYRIVDATGDMDRAVDGQIRLTVRSRPGKPGVPVEDAVGDGFVRLKWTSGPDNGEPVIGTKVTARSETGLVQVWDSCGPTNLCTVEQLQNGIKWTFSVVETNSLGDSDPSGTSAESRPDVKPEQASPPVAHHGDKQLRVTWTPPVNRGSPIEFYRLTILGDRPMEPMVFAKGEPAFEALSYTWTGLTNGTNYNFTLEAKNLTDEWSIVSAPSANEHPSGPPSPPQSVGALDSDGKNLTVTWVAPADLNGDPILHYTVTASPSGLGSPRSVQAAADARTATVSGLLNFNQASYTVTVEATTRGGSTVSAPFGPFVMRATPTSTVTATAAEANGTVPVTFPARASDADWTHLRVTPEFNGVLQEPLPNLVDGSAGAFNIAAVNGTSVRVHMQTCVVIPEQSNLPRCNPTSSISNAVVPFGPLLAPTMTVRNVELNSWIRPVIIIALEGAGLNGVPADEVSYWFSISGGPPQQVAPGQRIEINTAEGARRVTGWAQDNRNGQAGAVSTVDVSPPIVATRLADDRITVTLSGWPGTDGPIECRAYGVSVPPPPDQGPTPTPAPTPVRISLDIPVPVNMARDGSATGGPYVFGSNPRIHCQQQWGPGLETPVR